MEVKCLPHTVSCPGLMETLTISLRCSALEGKQVKAYIGDCRMAVEQSKIRKDVKAAPLCTKKLTMGSDWKSAKGEIRINPTWASKQRWWCRLKVYVQKGPLQGFAQDRVAEACVPIPCQDLTVCLDPVGSGTAIVDIVRVFDNQSLAVEKLIEALPKGLEVMVAHVSSLSELDSIKEDVDEDLGPSAFAQAVTADVVRAARVPEVVRPLTEQLLEAGSPAQRAKPAWRRELALEVPVVPEHLQDAGASDFLQRSVTLGGLRPIEVAIQRHEWAVVRAILSHGVRLNNPEHLLHLVLKDCKTRTDKDMNEEVAVAGDLMMYIAKHWRLQRVNNLARNCLEIDDLTNTVFGGVPRGFIRRWTEAAWREASADWDGQPEVLQDESDGTAAECGICFTNLYKSQPAIFTDSHGRRVCSHYLCFQCADQQKGAQSYDSAERPRLGNCPFCRAEFSKVQRLPDPTVDPKGFFWSIPSKVSEGHVSQKEVLSVLRVLLPTSEEFLNELMQGELWQQWDMDADGKISEQDFLSEGGLWMWLVVRMISLKLELAKTTKTSATPVIGTEVTN